MFLGLPLKGEVPGVGQRTYEQTVVLGHSGPLHGDHSYRGQGFEGLTAGHDTPPDWALCPGNVLSQPSIPSSWSSDSI